MKLFQKVFRFIALNMAAILGKINYNYYKKTSKNADKKSEQLLLKLIKKNKNTEFGKKYDFANIKSIKEYQEKVPYTTYEDYKNDIARIAEKGEQNILTSGKVKYFANTSGTTGQVKRIPVINESYNTFFKAGTIFMYQLKNEMKKNNKGAMNGKVLNLSEMVSKKTPSGIREGYISGYFAAGLKAFLPIVTCMPKEALGNEDYIDMKYIKARYAMEDDDIICINAVFMSAITDLMKYIQDNHEMLIRDIENGTIDASIRMPENIRKKLEKKLKPNKKRADELKEIFSNSNENTFVLKMWKRLSLIIAICTGEFSPFETQIRKYCGKDIAISYSMYASSEATIASSLNKEDKNYMILFDGGFYEFIPIEGEENPLLINELEIGKEYEIVVTNLSGLYRYRIKDVVKVVGFEGKAPLIQFSFRKEQLINISAVHLTMGHMVDVIKRLENDLKISITDYSVFPDTEHSPSRITLFLEVKDEVIKDNIDIAELFDEKIIETTPAFKAILEHGNAAKSVVYFVKPGTYEKYREMRAKKATSVNQVKTVRLIKDEATLKYFLDSSKIAK